MSKKLSKCNAAFDYVENISIALFATSGRISIISFTTVIRTPPEIASTSSSFVFFLISEIIKKLFKNTRNKKKNQNNVMLAKTKLNSIETLVSQASCMKKV